MSSLTPTEQAVLTRWDQGKSIDEIAHDTGFARRTVKSIATYYGADPFGEVKRARRNAANGSAMLAARIAAVHGERAAA